MWFSAHMQVPYTAVSYHLKKKSHLTNQINLSCHIKFIWLVEISSHVISFPSNLFMLTLMYTEMFVGCTNFCYYNNLIKLQRLELSVRYKTVNMQCIWLSSPSLHFIALLCFNRSVPHSFLAFIPLSKKFSMIFQLLLWLRKL